MENPMARIYRKMMKDLEKLPQNWVTTFQEEMGKWTQELLKDAFDPAKMMKVLRGMGVDMGQFSQMFSGMASSGTMPQGFDPYVILHLDKSASDEEVKQVYRKVMSKIHPDRAGPELTTVAALVNAAYQYIKKERGLQ